MALSYFKDYLKRIVTAVGAESGTILPVEKRGWAIMACGLGLRPSPAETIFGRRSSSRNPSQSFRDSS
jgi:hypothetical protein